MCQKPATVLRAAVLRYCVAVPWTRVSYADSRTIHTLGPVPETLQSCQRPYHPTRTVPEPLPSYTDSTSTPTIPETPAILRGQQYWGMSYERRSSSAATDSTIHDVSTGYHRSTIPYVIPHHAHSTVHDFSTGRHIPYVAPYTSVPGIA
eukprot:3277074-Rhodomonas_salina.1